MLRKLLTRVREFIVGVVLLILTGVSSRLGIPDEVIDFFVRELYEEARTIDGEVTEVIIHATSQRERQLSSRISAERSEPSRLEAGDVLSEE